MHPIDYSKPARSLLKKARDAIDHKYGFSTASCQIHDTAWTSMVAKIEEDKKVWLFPQCFSFLLESQGVNGGWSSQHSSQTAAIIDTASALLALLKHHKEPLQVKEHDLDVVALRITMAKQWLTNALARWQDLDDTNHISVEFLVPALLRYLEGEDSSVRFSYPNQAVLASMAAGKMAKCRPQVVYEMKSSSYVYSLESFIDVLDFDKVGHQKLRDGSMWTSPASTAAYLINTTTWDEDAEQYLLHVVRQGQGHGRGGVPGTFPTHLFELNWIITTMLQAGFTAEDLAGDELSQLSAIIKQAFVEGRGIIGHSPQTADADDTAKGLLVLRLLDLHGDVATLDAVLNTYEREDGFATFEMERDRSLSTNCHILITLVSWGDMARFANVIQKAAGFVIDFWWNTIGTCKDKWHLSPLYPRMLLMKALVELFRALMAEPELTVLDKERGTKAAIVTVQICIRTLVEQHENGSWHDSLEQTSYAVLILTEARRLSCLVALRDKLESAMRAGAHYLTTSHQTASFDQCWTSKTQYSLELVAEAYILSAAKASREPPAFDIHAPSSEEAQNIRALDQVEALFEQTKKFSCMAKWLLRAALIEGTLWLPLLKERRQEVFPRDHIRVSKDSYLGLLPALWTTCNYRSRSFVPDTFIYEMLMMTLVNIQVDEYIEGIVTSEYEGQDMQVLHDTIERVVNLALEPGKMSLAQQADDDGYSSRQKIFNVLLQFARYSTRLTLNASKADSDRLALELRRFLHAQITQIGDNRSLKERNVSGRAESSSRQPLSYFEWVRSAGSDHVSTPFSWAWVCAWLSAHLGDGREVFGTSIEQYLASATMKHLSTTNRMFNDYGSVPRDLAESNLNSIHFFGEQETSGIEAKREALRVLAEYEHDSAQLARDRLDKVVIHASVSHSERSFDRQKMLAIGLLCDVSSLWDALYVLKDLSSSIPERRVGTLSDTCRGKAGS